MKKLGKLCSRYIMAGWPDGMLALSANTSLQGTPSSFGANRSARIPEKDHGR